MVTRRERHLLGVTCAAAVAAPLAMSLHLDARVQDDLVPAMSRATGQRVRLGGVEADLTGALRLRDVVVGELFSADAVEAAVSLDSILAGELAADEIRVHRPRVRARVAADGSSDWQEMLAHVASRRGGRGGRGGGRRLRRIVVSGGDLVADLGGARVALRDVELHPQAGGVRLVTGAATMTAAAGPFRLRGELGRIGADVTLPRLGIDRVVAVGGGGEVVAGGARLAARAVDVVRDQAGGPWRISADVDDRGAPRHVEVTLARAAGATAITVRGDRVPLAVLGAMAPRGVGLERAHASGALTVGRGAGAIVARAELALDGAWIDHPGIAEVPVPLDGALELDLSIAGGRVDARRLRLHRGALDVTATGWIRRAGRRVVAADLSATLAPGDCRGLIDAFPASLRGPLDQLVVRGTLAGRARVAFDLDDPGADGVHLALDLDPRSCDVVADAPGADPRTLTGAVEQTFADGTHAVVGPGLGDWADLGILPGHVRGAFVAAEDARFWDHAGFDLEQIARSLEVDLRERRFARGGSTISQQLVKNSFLDQRRTLLRKLHEAVLTWRLEATLDKRAILGRYLNVIELGPGIHGVGAAARYWFDRAPERLDVRQAAFLAAITPAPRSSTARIARHHGLDPETAERVAVVLRAMRRAGVIDADTARAAMDAPLAFRPAAVGR